MRGYLQTLLLLVCAACALRAAPAAPAAPARAPPSRPVPVVIWHGLGDRFDNPGLETVKADLEARPELNGIYVHIVQLAQDGPADQRASFFGLANDQVAAGCDQLAQLANLTDPVLNPSRQFDAIGFSQGGQFLRAVVERCSGAGLGGVTVRNLITLGSQHMGISALPPCPPGSSPFSFCRLMHLSLVRQGIYSHWAQQNIVPAQYFRDPDRIDEYLAANDFLRDLNNEREGDEQAYAERASGLAQDDDEPSRQPRNETYKENLAALNRFVMFRFSKDSTVVPPHSAHFTLPVPPSPPSSSSHTDTDPCLPPCYAPALPWPHLPLYAHDYVGLRRLDESGRRVQRAVCEGEHMQIEEECWGFVLQQLGEAGAGEVPEGEFGARELESVEGEEGGDRVQQSQHHPGLVFQL